MISYTEENYLKAIYHLDESHAAQTVSTSALAEATGTTAASVTDMIKRLSDKKLIHYKKYQGVRLTDAGRELALKVIRRHRLWEVFLVEKLGFSWDEIHSIAEKLEHINSDELTNRLERFLNFPVVDPHGDPIPNIYGEMPHVAAMRIAAAPVGLPLVIKSVSEDSSVFLQHLNKLNIQLGTVLEVEEVSVFDQSVTLRLDTGQVINISEAVANNLYVEAYT